MDHHFIEHTLIVLTTGTLAGYACRQFSWPPLMGYLAVGTLIGESLLGWIPADVEEISHLAELGVFFLLFSIGLELSLGELRKLGRYLLVGGTTQMLLVAVPVSLLLMLTGWKPAVALLVGCAAAFSSTVLVFKSLGELGMTASASGRRAISILLFQDAALVPLLLCIPLLIEQPPDAATGRINWWQLILASAGFVGATVLLRAIFNQWLIPRITRHRSPDLVVLMTLVVLGSVTLTAYRAGLPPALGAFAAGLIFGGNRWSEQVDTLILPFREAFAAIFFVSLGLLIDLSSLTDRPLTILGAFLLLTAFKTLSAWVALWLTRLSFRQSWGPAVGLAHVGEFAFVLVLVGTTAGAITAREQQFLITLFGLTLLAAPVLIRLGFTRARQVASEDAETTEPLKHFAHSKRSCLVIGMGPVGRAVGSRLDTYGFAVTAVDSNPLNLQAFAQLGFPTVTGDAQQERILVSAGVDRAGVIVICIPIDEVAVRVAKTCRQLNPDASILVRCRYANQIEAIEQAGADVVVSEEARSTQELVRLVEQLSQAEAKQADTPSGS
jgi:CPA2 family monovalent cation:H+ antiporter-2